MGRYEKDRIRVSAKMMAEDMKRADAIAEIPCDLFWRTAINKIGAKSLVNALSGIRGFDKEFAALA